MSISAILATAAQVICFATSQAQDLSWLPASQGTISWLFDIAGLLGLFGMFIMGFHWILGPSHTHAARRRQKMESFKPASIAERHAHVQGSHATAAESGYELGRVIGEGGMGLVYEGHDIHLRRKVAIKELRPELQQDQALRERFLREARTVAMISHPNVVTIHTVINTPKRTLLVFEYVRGLTVSDLIDKSPNRRVALRDVAGITRQVCMALAFAHSKHVIHRDLKPSNIMIEDSGRVKVMDFGIARQAKDSMMTVTKTVLGTPYYMAPEAEDGGISKEADLYSLGICVYEMLAGDVPFRGQGIKSQKMSGAFKPLAQIDPRLDRLDGFLKVALAPEPKLRYHSAKEFYSAFHAAIS